MKTCKCCGRSYTPEGWRALPLVGLQPFPELGILLELRNCIGPACKATLVIELVGGAESEDALPHEHPAAAEA